MLLRAHGALSVGTPRVVMLAIDGYWTPLLEPYVCDQTLGSTWPHTTIALDVDAPLGPTA